MLTAYADGRLFGAASGNAKPWVLALHGWRRTHRDFDRALAGIDAIALDLPGFGASPEPPDAWGSAAYAEAILPVLDAFDSAPVVLGHSFGGRVAVQLAAAHPDRVRALVLTGVPFRRPPGEAPPKVKAGFKFVRFLYRRGLISEARKEALARRYGSSDYATATGVMRAVSVVAVQETNATYDEQLAKIHCPVELVWGENDTAAPVAVARLAAELLEDATITVLHGVGHLTPTEAPEALAAALERCRTGSGHHH